jgi:hypothetical protein
MPFVHYYISGWCYFFLIAPASGWAQVLVWSDFLPGKHALLCLPETVLDK